MLNKYIQLKRIIIVYMDGRVDAYEPATITYNRDRFFIETADHSYIIPTDNIRFIDISEYDSSKP